MLTFNGLQVAHDGEPQIPPWSHAHQTNVVAGLDGATNIDLGKRPRRIVIPAWIDNNYSTSAACITALETLESKVGTKATLTISGLVDYELQHCRFDGFEKHRGPIYSSELGWFAIGRLTFVQLAPNQNPDP